MMKATPRGSLHSTCTRIALYLILCVKAAYSQCTICAEGQQVSLPDNILSLPGFPPLPCGTVDTTLSILISNATSPECNTVQSLGSLCGCPSRNDACSLCSDGTLASRPDNDLPFLSDLFLGFTPTCQILESYLTSIGNDESLCFVAQSYMSDYCGCSSEVSINPAPCSLCPLGETASLPDKSIAMDGFPFQTCSQLEDALSLLLEQDAQECSLLSQAFAKLCGCSGGGSCVLCQDGSPIPLPNNTIEVFKDMFSGIAPSCEVYESFVAGFDASSEECSNAQLFGSYCGCPALPDHCVFCPGEEISEEYANKEIDELILLVGLKGGTCSDAADFLQYQIPQDDSMCGSGRAYNHVCGCNDGIFSYLDADTRTKQAVLANAPRISAFISFLGSAMIMIDILCNRSRRQKVYSQLVLAMSLFDIIGAIAWMLSTAPINSDFVYGAVGTEATCKMQGVLVQLGFTSVYYNVSLSTYYLLVIVYGWRDRRLKKNRWWLHGVPLTVGFGLSFGGIPFYQNAIFGCHIQSPPFFEKTWYPIVFFIFVPVFGAIFLTTIMMTIVYCKVRRQNRRAAKWKFASLMRQGSLQALRGKGLFGRRSPTGNTPANEDTPSHPPSQGQFGGGGGGGGDASSLASAPASHGTKRRQRRDSTSGGASSKLERQVFVQSVLYVSAFYLCWSFLLASEIVASPVAKNNGNVYPFYLVCFIMAPLQGAWNAVIYFRPRLQSRENKWRSCGSRRPKRESMPSEPSDCQSINSSRWLKLFNRRGGGMSQLVASIGSEASDHSKEVDPSILIADNASQATMESNISASLSNDDGELFNEAGSMSAIQEELAELDLVEGMIENFPEEESL